MEAVRIRLCLPALVRRTECVTFVVVVVASR